MTKGKRISTDIGGDALHTIREPGVAIGHVLGLLALYAIGVSLQQPAGG
ncbi:hypothetical protein [Variovorax sp. OV329]|nr:hypothetical protein [Variovorax sp. OV329]SFM64523.1 hypothetical protein SAMN05444747_107125 [Variovorax sp. OV329]